MFLPLAKAANVFILPRLAGVCQEASGGVLPFRLPDILVKMRCETPRQLYVLAWSISNEAGVFTFTPKYFSSISERTRRRWAARLVKWKLWDLCIFAKYSA